ncbi:MAG: cellulase family glycosylhydrolase, partial [candidate division KSB1 bacterium]|nr:cellulase family glycosylhydrolase [candidate division KSB1 bacterium]
EMLDFITDIWTDPANVAWLNEFEEYVILNIANEWGPSDDSDQGRRIWRDAYKESIRRIREAGINNMLVIDSPNCGQGPRAMEVYGRELLDFDPQHNLVFSIHMYGMWRTLENAAEVGRPNKDMAPWAAEWELQTMLDLGLPVIVGEFSWKEASSVGYDTRRLIAFCQEKGIGWLAWSWNGNSDPLLDMARGWKYDSDADLYPFGDLIVNHPRYGLRATSVKATAFGTPNQRPAVTLDPGSGPFSVGSDIILTASAADADGQVTRVEFYRGEEKLGQDTTPPFTFTWKNVPRGRHELFAAAWDDAGQIGVSQSVELRVGYREKTRKALLVVGEIPLRPGDVLIEERLGMLGFEVTPLKDADAKPESALPYDLVLISATCVPTRLKATFRNVDRAVLIWESQLYDDMSMSGSRINLDYGRDEATAVVITADAHPAAANLNGRVTVYAQSDRLSWANPTPSATIVAASGLVPQHPVIFFYRTGDQLVDRTAPAPRAAFFLQDDSALNLTVDGWRLFDALVDYLVSEPVQNVSEPSTPQRMTLLQNYPNPFNPLTAIEFTLDRPGRALLEIYNCAGELVCRLLESDLQPGRHRLVWDGKDSFGKAAASGVYVCRLTLEAGGEVLTAERKMTLLR